MTVAGAIRLEALSQRHLAGWQESRGHLISVADQRLSSDLKVKSHNTHITVIRPSSEVRMIHTPLWVDMLSSPDHETIGS